MAYLTSKQQLKIKSLIVDINNCLSKNFSFFDNLNKELSLGFYSVDTFLDYFSFHLVNQKNTCNKLNSIYKDLLINQDIILNISDNSIKNNITTLISHIYREQEIITKTIYAINVTSTETKLFTIKYNINCAT